VQATEPAGTSRVSCIALTRFRRRARISLETKMDL
jgi:hypothetical protein